MSQMLSLVIPCFNPLPGWDRLLVDNTRKLSSFLQRDIRLVLVNDASEKNVEQENINYLQQNYSLFQYISYPQNKGKGYALRQGVDRVEEGFILYTDIDLPYEFESMKAVVQALEDGADIAAGTRDGFYYENTPKSRTIISKLLRFMMKAGLKLKVTDTQCGLKAFNQKGREVFMQTRINRFLFDMEFIALASGNPSIVLQPVAVTLRSDIRFSKINTGILLTEMWNFFRIFWITNFRKQ